MSGDVWKPFESVFDTPLRNGLTRPKRVRGSGVPMVNMGELFANRRINRLTMDRVPMEAKESGFLLQPGDLLFARQSLVLSGAGKCVLFQGADEPVTYESHIIRARLNPKVADSEFYFYFFESRIGRKTIESIVEQVAAAGIRGSDLKMLKVPTPPLPEQRAIAHILGALDDKIELNRRMNQTLEDIARALFKSWFVDFDPVRAKAEGRQPVGMDAETAAMFPDSFQEPELGLIPTGWTIKGLSEIATFLNGLALQKYPPEGEDSLPVIKIAQLRAGKTTGADRSGLNVPHEYVVHDGDVLFSWSGTLEVEIWRGGTGALNQHLFKVTSETFPKWFYFFATRAHLPFFREVAHGKATTMGHIQRHHIKEALVVCPPFELLSAVGQRIGTLLDRIVGSSLESQTLASVRDTLLPKLVSGELRVPDAEKVLAESPL